MANNKHKLALLYDAIIPLFGKIDKDKDALIEETYNSIRELSPEQAKGLMETVTFMVNKLKNIMASSDKIKSLENKIDELTRPRNPTQAELVEFQMY